MTFYLKNQPPAAVKTGWAMRSKTGRDVGFSWDKDDPRFGPEWARVAMTPATAMTEHNEPVDSKDIEKALYWFSVLTKCARLLDLPGDEPIPSGVLAAVERITSAPQQAKALTDNEIRTIAYRVGFENQWRRPGYGPDLHDYVYEFARAILATQPAVQPEKDDGAAA